MARKYKQGIYTPINKEKWIGGSPVYRSSWELKFFKWADHNKSVIKIASEQITIPYYFIGDNKMHTYYPDIYMECIGSSGEKKRILVEIKPRKEINPPVRGRKTNAAFLSEVMTYEKNQAKWIAAEEWCKMRNINFMVIDEYMLGISK